MPQDSPSATPGFGARDALYVLFKRKWMILLPTLAGLGAAAAVFHTRQPIYESQAKLLVRYVLTRDSTDSFESHSAPGGGRVDPVTQTEIEILTSMDLALEVADSLDPRDDPGMARNEAAAGILAGFKVAPGQSNKVLNLLYADEDPRRSRTVLREIVERYFEKHLDIHRSAAAFDLISRQAAEARARMETTEKELNQLRTGSGILSLADATGALASQRARTQDDLMQARAELAEKQAGVRAMEEALGKAAATAIANGEPEPDEELPPTVAAEYRTLLELLEFLQKRELELQVKFKPGNRLLVLNEQQLASCETRRRDLLARYPALAATPTVATPSGTSDPLRGLLMEKAKLAAITSKIEVYESHLREIAALFSGQYATGAKIDELERKRQMEETEYRNLETNLKNARVDQTLDPSRMPNITVVQHPTEPVRRFDRKSDKLILGLAGGGLALGLLLAFGWEILFDRKVNRPVEIQTRLQLPLLMSIPHIRRRERGGLLVDPAATRLLTDATLPAQATTSLVVPDATRTAVDRRPGHFILPYTDTIRDRIIFNFEVNQITHKPKLLAVTGLSGDAGTSTIAAGLARSFSEIPGAKVLLVDLSSHHPQDHPLFGEVPRHSLKTALRLASDSSFRSNPRRIYYASAGPAREPGDPAETSLSPIHLHELLPRLQGCGYDYIIFDMPAIDRTSRTLTMAGMMDKVLLVLDAGNTSRDALLWGYSELIKGRADVSCIFNKARDHAPSWIQDRA
jgi:polysaccharide biosynthesis transport protein